MDTQPCGRLFWAIYGGRILMREILLPQLRGG